MCEYFVKIESKGDEARSVSVGLGERRAGQEVGGGGAGGEKERQRNGEDQKEERSEGGRVGKE